MKNNLKNLLNHPKYVASVSAILAIIIGLISYLYINKDYQYQTYSVTTGTISSGDSSIGLSPMHDLTLAFLTSGRINDVFVHVGDMVKKGQTLAVLDAQNAIGSLTQAKAAYTSMEANYQKVINGATGASVDVAKAALATAKVALDQSIKQQNVLVKNARTQLFSQGLQAIPDISGMGIVAPTISGNYTKDTEGIITLTIYQTGDGGYFTASGLVSGSGKVSTTTPQPIGDSGLSVLFSVNTGNQPNWNISIPNKNSIMYTNNYNTYQAAIQTQESIIANNKSQVAQAEANLVALQAAARPEDVAQAQAQLENARGLLQIAQGTYSNSVIIAPSDGKITMVSVTKGQIATANVPALEMVTDSILKDNAIIIPKNALIINNSHSYVRVKSEKGTEERLVVTGIENKDYVEIITGLQVGEKILVLN